MLRTLTNTGVCVSLITVFATATAGQQQELAIGDSEAGRRQGHSCDRNW